jgi:hypothetical protein
MNDKLLNTELEQIRDRIRQVIADLDALIDSRRPSLHLVR